MDKAAVSHAGDPGTIPGFPSLILWSSIELIFSHPKVLWLFAVAALIKKESKQNFVKKKIS
mgnify:CR=1 FL=1